MHVAVAAPRRAARDGPALRQNETNCDVGHVRRETCALWVGMCIVELTIDPLKLVENSCQEMEYLLP